jgi:Preprotein translocase subunit SecB
MGKEHLRGSYYIFEAELFIAANIFLDLVGNRQSMKYITELMRRYSRDYNEGEKWQLGKFIEFLKILSLAVQDSGLFPYKVIRAVDSSYNRRVDTYPFSPRQKAHFFPEDQPDQFAVKFELELTAQEKTFPLKVDFYALFETTVRDEAFRNSDFLHINAPAIAYPFLRSFVATLTANADFAPVMLPTVNFNHYKK